MRWDLRQYRAVSPHQFLHRIGNPGNSFYRDIISLAMNPTRAESLVDNITPASFTGGKKKPARSRGP